MFRWIAAVSLCLASMAQAQDRFALVIGNGAYETVPALSAPTANADRIAESLENLGFEVETVRDANLVSLKRSIGAFSQRVRNSGPESMALLYFAGHGVNAFSDNFLLPVDVQIETPEDLDFVAVNVTTLLYGFDPSIRARNIVILDCCSENPYPAVDGVSGGLVEMSVPEENFLAFAVPPGAALEDSNGTSPFAQALATSMAVPGRSTAEVFSSLADAGLTEVPYFDSGLGLPFIFAEGTAPTEEQLAWELAQNATASADMLVFLEQFPGGEFEDQAKRKLLDLLAAELGTASEIAVTQPAENIEPTEAAAEPVEEVEPAQEVVETAAPPVVEDVAEEPAQPVEEEVVEEVSEPVVEEEVAEEVAPAEAEELIEEEVVEEAAEPVVEEEVAEDIAPTEAEDTAEAPAGPEDTAEPAIEEEVAEEAVTPDVEDTAETPLAEIPIPVFDQPLTYGDPAILGKSFAELVESTPLHPPIEDLPEELWKDQECTACHQWNQAELCTQAQFYLTAAGEEALTKEHPFGGTLKQNLRRWAEGDCP